MNAFPRVNSLLIYIINSINLRSWLKKTLVIIRTAMNNIN